MGNRDATDRKSSKARAVVAYFAVCLIALALAPAFLVPLDLALRAIIGSLYFSIFAVWFFIVPAVVLAVMSSFQPNGAAKLLAVVGSGMFVWFSFDVVFNPSCRLAQFWDAHCYRALLRDSFTKFDTGALLLAAHFLGGVVWLWLMRSPKES